MPEVSWTTLSRRIAAFGLDGHPGAGGAVSRETWAALIAPLDGQRLTGLALAAATSGWLELSDGQAEDLLERHRRAMMQALALERLLITVSGAFEESGIESLVLKGPALAHTFYPDPSWRPFADLDLLVRARDWRRACDVLADLGFQRDLPEPRPGFDERFGKAAAHTGREGLSLDLHRTLVVGPFGLWVEPEMLFQRTAPLEVGGVRLRRLDDTAVLLHACMHASLGWMAPLLLTVRDVAQVAGAADVDWGGLEELARRWRLRAVVKHAFETTRRTLGVRPPAEARALVAVRPTRRERRALAAYTTDQRGRGGTAVSTILAVPGLRAKAQYLRMLLFPSREFLAARSEGDEGASYLRRWAVPLRWLKAVFRRWLRAATRRLRRSRSRSQPMGR